MFKPEEPSSSEREAARQLLNDEEREILEAMDRDLGRPLTEEEEHLASWRTHRAATQPRA